IYDELYRILDGTEIMFDLDDVPDGASYGRMALTSISAGKIIIAGCDAEVTDQMFTSPAARNNVEAWKHASNVTMIDGGDIYTGSIVANSIAVNAIETDKIKADAVTASKINVNGLDGATGRIVVGDATDADVVTAGINAHATTLITAGKIVISGGTNLSDWRHAGGLTKIDGGNIYTDSIVADAIAAKTLTLGEISDTAFTEIGHQNLIRNSVFNYDGQTMDYLAGAVEPAFWNISKTAGTFAYCKAYAVPAHAKSPWDYVYYVKQDAIENDGTDSVRLDGEEYIQVDRAEPYTLSLWIKKVNAVHYLKWYLGLYFYDSDKVLCAPVSQAYPSGMSGITTTTDSWTRYSGTFGPNSDDYDIAFPADCKYVRIRYFPVHLYGSGEIQSSMSTGLQLEPGDKLTNWKPHMTPEEWVHENDATYIDGGKIYTESIVAGSIAANAITTVKINAQAVEADKIKTGTITATQIAANAITTAKINADAVTTEKIDAGAITATEIATDAITTIKIKADAVTANEISVTSLSAISANVGILTAGTIRSTTLYIGKDASHEVQIGYKLVLIGQ
ncbi:MAG: hypothetical protein JRJ57_12385, partial [Deltaproteobacteria bacterium]|nr:hypothetical protein [Deltaproteobacteria bacterium]